MYEELKKEMERKKMCAMKLAGKAGISPSDLYQALKGKKPFFPAWRKRIAEVLQVPESDIFPESEEAKR